MAAWTALVEGRNSVEHESSLADLRAARRHIWSKLKNQQLGAYAEYFFKMELTMAGFQVYSTEVDDRGVDFIVRHESGPFREIQVKSLRVDPQRPSGYVFLQKSKFALRCDVLLAMALFYEGREPDLYLVPAERWLTPDNVFCDRSYGGSLKSKPEWGLSITRKGLPSLKQFSFDETVERMLAPAA